MKKFGYLIIILGIIIIILPIAQDIHTSRKQEKLINSYIEIRDQSPVDPEEILRELIERLPVSDEILEPGDTNSENSQRKDKKNKDDNVIGIINIPTIKVNLPLFYDATESNLWKGAALTRGTSFPWEKGNTSIASHRGRTYGYLFNRLHELKKGDLIVLDFLGRKYEYEVYEILTVSPEDTWILENIENKTTVTLITCTPSGTKRLIIRGMIVD